VNEGQSLLYTRLIDDEAGPPIIQCIHDHRGVPDKSMDVFLRDLDEKGFDHNFWVESSQLLSGSVRLRATNIPLPTEDLTTQVTQLKYILIQDNEVTDARNSKINGGGAAQPPSSGHDNLR
jgi:hypothetical protein